MNIIHLYQIRGSGFFFAIILLLSACTAIEGGGLSTTPLPPSTIHSSLTRVNSTSISISTPSSVESTQISDATSTQTAISVQQAINTSTVTRSPDPTITFTPSPTVLPTSALMEGPLIAYRVQNDENYLLLLDIGTLTFREIRKDFLIYPFGLEWLDTGCNLYIHGNVINLQGNIVEEIADWEDDNEPFKVLSLSPDRMWGVNELFLVLQRDFEKPL